MNNRIGMVLLLGLLLLTIVSPFAALSLLMITLLVGTVAWMAGVLIGGTASTTENQQQE